MFIKRVMLNNIRSYTNQQFIFRDGSTLLSGDIGSGKTTILLAIEFCLFGMRRDLSGNALLRNGANEGFVELEFSIGGKNIIIKRTLKRYKDGVKQTSGYIISNNTRSDLTAQEIKARVLEMLGYPISLLTKSKNLMYRYTVYTQQEDMKQILLDDKDNRVDTLRKIFGIDKYKNIRENSLIYIKYMKNIRNRLKGKVEDLDQKNSLLNEKKEIIAKLDESLEKINKEISELDFDYKKKQFQETESRLNQYNKLKNELEILITKKDQIDKNKQRLTNEINNLEKEINEKKQALETGKSKLKKPTDKTIEELNKTISYKEIIYMNTIKEKNILNEKLSHVRTRINEFKKELDSKSEKIKDLKFKKQSTEHLKQDVDKKPNMKNNINELNEKIHKINMKLKEFEINILNSKKLKQQIGDLSKCPTCLQTVSIDHKFTINQKEAEKLSKLNILTQRYEKEKQTRIKQLEELNKEFEELLNKDKLLMQMITEVKNLEETSVEIDKKKKILDNFNLELIKTNKEIEKINSVDLDEMKNEISTNKELVIELNKYHIGVKEINYLEEQLVDRGKSLEKLNNEIENAKQESEKTDKHVEESITKLKEFDNIEEKYVKEKQMFEELQNKQKDCSIQKVSIEKEHEVVLRHVNELKKEIQEKEQDKKKIQHYNQLQNWLENYFIKTMYVIEKNVMFSIYQQFNDLFKEWFSILIENEEINVRLDEEFTPVIEQNGYDIDFGNLSGGERTSVALAYRLALNKVVNEVQSQIKTKDLLILDEPTDGFSSEQLDKVRIVLDELGLGQVIIVSHESKIESYVENVIRVEKNEHVSQVIP